MNMETPRILVIAAHMGDFVWRCGGTIAKYAKRGSEIKVIVMSDGLRGEANDFWKEEGATEEAGHAQRFSEGETAAKILGAKGFKLIGMQDYPMSIDASVVELLAHEIREFGPNVILTHTDYDQFNPDHNEVTLAVRKADAAASGLGFPDEHPAAQRHVPIFGFEPQMTEISGFKPTVYVDISDAFDVKLEAMHAFKSQPNMYKGYIRKAELRGNEAKNRGNCKGCKYAEAYSLFQPIASTGDLVW